MNGTLKLLAIGIIGLAISGCAHKKDFKVSSNASHYKLNDYSFVEYETTIKDPNHVEIFCKGEYTSIRKIDGKNYQKAITFNPYNSIVTTPGLHHILFYAASGNHWIKYNFKAKHKYLIDYNAEQKGQYITGKFWLYDLTDKKTVFGKKDNKRIYQD